MGSVGQYAADEDGAAPGDDGRHNPVRPCHAVVYGPRHVDAGGGVGLYVAHVSHVEAVESGRIQGARVVARGLDWRAAMAMVAAGRGNG